MISKDRLTVDDKGTVCRYYDLTLRWRKHRIKAKITKKVKTENYFVMSHVYRLKTQYNIYTS